VNHIRVSAFSVPGKGMARMIHIYQSFFQAQDAHLKIFNPLPQRHDVGNVGHRLYLDL